MALNKALQAFIDEGKNDDSYWVEQAKMNFAFALEKQRSAVRMTLTALSQKLGTSVAYVSKIFRGDTNVTIESMVKLARATGGQLDIQIVDARVTAHKWDLDKLVGMKVIGATPQTPVTVTTDYSANNPKFHLLEEA